MIRAQFSPTARPMKMSGPSNPQGSEATVASTTDMALQAAVDSSVHWKTWMPLRTALASAMPDPAATGRMATGT